MSSTFQISMAVAGGLVLAGVVAHSAWSSRRNRPKQATPPAIPEPEAAKTPVPDELRENRERLEPSFDTDTGPDSDSGLAALTSLTTPEKSRAWTR